MSTLNGFGTMFYGWRHRTGEASSATKWLTVFYVPIFPLGRYKLKVTTDFRHDPTEIRMSAAGLLASRKDHFESSERTRLVCGELILTYASAFVGLPLLTLWPLSILWLLGKLEWLPLYESAGASTWAAVVALAVTGCALCNVLYWPIWAIRKSRGMQREHPRRRNKRRSYVDRHSVEHHISTYEDGDN